MTQGAWRKALLRGITLREVQKVLVTAKAVQKEPEGWRVVGGRDSEGHPLDPVVRGNITGILVVDL